jgi:protein-tyrosine phosphatase
VLDLHCHLLPGIDDGPTTLEDALDLARAMVTDGITHAVCTPHVFPGRYDNVRTAIAQAFDGFAAELARAEVFLELSWAGEVRLTPEVLDLLAEGEVPFLGQVAGKRTMLLELPDGMIPLGADRFTRALLRGGVRPVIAHPERNRSVMEDPERLRPFFDDGCYVQLTAGSLVGQFGERAQTTARRLLDEGWVHAIASDCHNLGGRRPRMRDAQQWLEHHYGPEAARQLTVLGPAGLCAHNALVNA